MNKINTNKLVVSSNVRQGSKMRTTEYRQLKNSIKAIGMQTPITVYRNGGSEYIVLDGHQRLSIAQELNIVEVPYYETMADQVNVQQISANAFTIPMTTFEASDVIAALLEENPDYTRKNIANLFGRKVKWVDQAVKLTNLIPEIRGIKDLDLVDVDVLLSIARSPIQVQKKVYNMQGKEAPVTHWDVGEMERLCRPYGSYHNKNIHKLTEMIPLKVLRKAEKEAGVRPEYTNSLFSEYDKEYFCDDEEFIYDLFMAETEVGREIFKDIPLITEKTKANVEKTLTFDIWKSKAKFYKEFAWYCNNKYSEVNIVAWDGDPFAPVVMYDLKKTSKEDTKEPTAIRVEKEQASLERQIKKLSRLFKPVLVSYMKDNIDILKSEDNKNIALFWLLENNHGYELNMSTYGMKDTFENTRAHLKDVNTTTKVIFDEKIRIWFGERYDMNSFDTIGDLLKRMNLHTLKEIFETGYVENKEFRKETFNCFTIATLKNLCWDSGNDYNSKVDIVNYLTQTYDGKNDENQFPLIDDFIDNLPNFNIRELG